MSFGGHASAMQTILRNCRKILVKDYKKFNKENIKFNSAFPGHVIKGRKLTKEEKQYYKDKNIKANRTFDLIVIISIVISLALAAYIFSLTL